MLRGGGGGGASLLFLNKANGEFLQIDKAVLCVYSTYPAWGMAKCNLDEFESFFDFWDRCNPVEIYSCELGVCQLERERVEIVGENWGLLLNSWMGTPYRGVLRCSNNIGRRKRVSQEVLMQDPETVEFLSYFFEEVFIGVNTYAYYKQEGMIYNFNRYARFMGFPRYKKID